MDFAFGIWIWAQQIKWVIEMGMCYGTGTVGHKGLGLESLPRTQVHVHHKLYMGFFHADHGALQFPLKFFSCP